MVEVRKPVLVYYTWESDPQLIDVVGPIGLSKTDFAKLNQSDEQIASLGKEQGGGYYSTLEVHHQLHCLVHHALMTDSLYGG